MAPPPGEISSDPAPAVSGTFTTDADRLTDHYRKIGEAEKHVYGGHSPARRLQYRTSTPSAKRRRRQPEAS
jgi:hypothetical protein